MKRVALTKSTEIPGTIRILLGRLIRVTPVDRHPVLSRIPAHGLTGNRRHPIGVFRGTLIAGFIVAWSAALGSASTPVPDSEPVQVVQIPQPDPRNIDPHRQLEQIMQDPLFSRWELRQGRQERAGREDVDWSWFDLSSYFDPIERWIEKLIEWVIGRPSPGNWPAFGGGSNIDLIGLLRVMGWTLLAVGIAIIAWMLYGLSRQKLRVRGGAIAVRAPLRQALEDGEALAATSDTWLDHAGELAQEQDLRLAFRATYLALLSGLHDRGKIRFRRQRTNWVYVSGFDGLDAQREVFTGLTQRFDDVWYGLQSPDDDAFRRVRESVQDLLSGDDA